PSFLFTTADREEDFQLIGAYPADTFAATIDALVAGEEPPTDSDAAQEPAELPYWANGGGLPPALDRPGHTMAGDPHQGHPAAATSDALVAGEEPTTASDAAQEPAELPYWANGEGLQPDLDRPGYTMAGDQYKGNPDAPLVIVEFSDFQCPSCARHALETQP